MAEGYAFPTGVEDGFHVELENGVTYEFKAEFKRWDVVKGTGSSVWITDELPDEQYTGNGDLWFDNTEDTMQLFLWHEESGAWLPVAPPTTLEGRVETGEQLQAEILARVEAGEVKQAEIDEMKVAKKGDSMTGSLAMNGHQITGLGTPKQRGHTVSLGFLEDTLEDYAGTEDVAKKLDKSGGTNNKMEGNFYMGGFYIAGVGDPQNGDHAINRRTMEAAIADIESSGGGGPTTKYDGNRFNVSGTSTKALSSGDVMFLSGDTSTNNILNCTGIALPQDEFNWDACAKAGVVKVKNGARVAGYFHVYDTQVNDGRNVILLVKLLQPGTDYTLEYDSGAPCYFHGVFFG